MTEQSRTAEALDYLEQLREASDRLDHAEYSHLHDLISAIAEPAACSCTGHSEDRGGGHFELVIEPEPGCPEHGAAIAAPQKPQPGKRLDPEFRAELIEFARLSIQAVWDDVPGGVDAETLAQNVVGAQEFAWISRGFPVAPQEPSKWEHGVIGGEDLLARLMDTLAYYHCRSVNPKADSPHLGYHAMSEDQREFLRERQREAAEEVLRMWQSEDRHAASPDRENLVRDAQKAAWAEIHGQDPMRKYSVAEVKKIVYSLDNAIAGALAAPVAVDKPKRITAHQIWQIANAEAAYVTDSENVSAFIEPLLTGLIEAGVPFEAQEFINGGFIRAEWLGGGAL